jgi:hypothetical protein
MRAILGLATLAFIGVIVADMVAHPDALKSGGNALNQILTTTFSGMLGNPNTFAGQVK